MKNILITAGATKVFFDDIHFLSNPATGKLGSLIAKEAVKKGINATYLYTEGSTIPSGTSKLLRKICIKTLNDLSNTLRTLLKTHRYTSIIHTMGISDYIPIRKSSGKIPSGKKSLCIKLKPTPKIINLIKILSPTSFLVGCKLESDVPQSELIKKAKSLIKKSGADIVIANDWKYLKKDNHIAFFVFKDRKTVRVQGKNTIAKNLLKYL